MGFITVILIIFGIVYSIWLFFFPLMVVKRLDKLIKILEKNEYNLKCEISTWEKERNNRGQNNLRECSPFFKKKGLAK